MNSTIKMLGTNMNQLMEREISSVISQGSIEIAMKTVSVLKQIISTESTWKTAGDLLQVIKQKGINIRLIFPCEPIICNIIRRVLKLIREEYHSCQKVDSKIHPSLHQIIKGEPDSDKHLSKFVPEFKMCILEALEELSQELEGTRDQISRQALEHIHANEIILTIGRSRTVERFLLFASSNGRPLQVIVAECGPDGRGHLLADVLARNGGIPTTIIPDSAIFAVMSRVNKVIIGTKAIMADGGLQTVVGGYTVALAAQHYSVPLIVCSSLYKLTPLYITSIDHHSNIFRSPQPILGQLSDKIRTVNPLFDYVPASMVSIFISNVSGYASSYVYRMLSELYSSDDDEF